jgi:hypothetical protein
MKTLKSTSARLDPTLAEVFKKAEARFFTEDELSAIVAKRPDLSGHVEAARQIDEISEQVVGRAMEELFAQYPYDKIYKECRVKIPRDVTYVLAYCVHSMVAEDPKWLDDKLLIWLRTILMSFEHPDRDPQAQTAFFKDPVLERRLQELPKNSRGIYHSYYRLRQEIGAELSPEMFGLIEPYLQQAMDTLTEER